MLIHPCHLRCFMCSLVFWTLVDPLYPLCFMFPLGPWIRFHLRQYVSHITTMLLHLKLNELSSFCMLDIRDLSVAPCSKSCFMHVCTYQSIKSTMPISIAILIIMSTYRLSLHYERFHVSHNILYGPCCT